MNRWFVVVVVTILGLNQPLLAEPTQYANPVKPGDFPDPSVVRVGEQFWATATSSEWAPHFPILHSKDLVNWDLVGYVFEQQPLWAVRNFWAPEITYDNGKFYLYYTARTKDERLAVAVATSDTPTGPYHDHGPLVSQAAGSIDGMAFTDQSGQRWLVWKEDGNSRNQPTPLWIQQLSEDGIQLVGKKEEILRNDADWEGAVVEGPFVQFHDGWYYLFYAGGACCGRDCNYGVGVARSRQPTGPFEKNPDNPILSEDTNWRCPGHGSLVQNSAGEYWFLYHAYDAESFVYTGREMMLDRITWDSHGWPRIGRGNSPTSNATAPGEGVIQSDTGTFRDDFEDEQLQLGWLWPHGSKPQYRLSSGTLELFASPNAAEASCMSALLARSSTTGDYIASTEVSLSASEPESIAGLAAIGDPHNAVGISATRDSVVIWRLENSETSIVTEIPLKQPADVQLRMQVQDGDQFKFAYRHEGANWVSIGEKQDGKYLPPWDRSIRIGLTVGGSQSAAGKFNFLEIRPLDPME